MQLALRAWVAWRTLTFQVRHRIADQAGEGVISTAIVPARSRPNISDIVSINGLGSSDASGSSWYGSWTSSTSRWAPAAATARRTWCVRRRHHGHATSA
jgi:hypothetical protein